MKNKYSPIIIVNQKIDSLLLSNLRKTFCGNPIIGIYLIYNNINENKYIGSSINIRSRIRSHKLSLCTRKHPNQNLQSDWDLYGASAFNWILLEAFNDKYKLVKREQFYIDQYKPEYNINPTAKNSLGIRIQHYSILGIPILKYEEAKYY